MADSAAPARRVLRHPDAFRQSLRYAILALTAWALGLGAVMASLPGRQWIALVLFPIALFLTYSAVRLGTLSVTLDQRGIVESAPLRKPQHIGWDDVARVRRHERKGAAGITFIEVQIDHREGWKHVIEALTTNSRDVEAEKLIDQWVHDIRDAKTAHAR